MEMKEKLRIELTSRCGRDEWGRRGVTSIEIKRRVDDPGRVLLSGDREVVEIIGTTAMTTKSIPRSIVFDVCARAPVHLRQYKMLIIRRPLSRDR